MSTKKIATTLLTIAIVIFALSMVYRWLERGGRFDLDEVTVRGIRSVDSSSVCEIIAPCFGMPIRTIDTDSLVEVFRGLSWVSDARISKTLPSGLDISIELQETVFIYTNGTQRYPLSPNGECLPSSFITDTIPTVTASTFPDSLATLGLVRWLMNDKDAAPDDIHLTERGISVFVSSGAEVVLGWNSLPDRWNDFILLTAIAPIQNVWLEIDMRYSDQAVLRYPIDEQSADGEDS